MPRSKSIKSSVQKAIDDENNEQEQKSTDIQPKKKGWVRNKQENFGFENVEPGDNSRYLRYALTAWEMPPIDISDEKQVEARIKEYFTWCVENDKKPQKVEMAMWLGVDVSTVRNWQGAETRAATHFAVIKKADAIFHSLWVDYMQNGKLNPASGIFLGKNLFGYRDQVDIVATPANPLGEEQTQKQLEDKAADIVISEDE